MHSSSDVGGKSSYPLQGMSFVHLARDWSAREVNTGGNLIDEVRIVDASGHEILVKWRLAEGQVLARLEVEEDSFPSLSGCGEVLRLLARLSHESENVTPELLCFELLRLGLRDNTQPYPPGESETAEKGTHSCGAPDL